MSDYFYSCPICGRPVDDVILKCYSCNIDSDNILKSKHIKDYYSKEAEKRFPWGEFCRGRQGGQRWTEILLEEVSQNPLFDEEKCKKRLEKEGEMNRKTSPVQKRQEANKPKCPTCGSTNISKISVASKVAGGAMFGLFSKTARSQFKCNNCGYKW